MKSIMYHYVLRLNKNLKYLNYLREDNFVKQIDYFKKNFEFFDCNQFFYMTKPIKNSLFLTFDDGLKCHYKVHKILNKKGINGIFYIPTQILEKSKILNVHKIHLILAHHGPKKSFEILNKFLERKMINEKDKQKFKSKIYQNQKDTILFSQFKKILNYYIKISYQDEIINKIFNYFFGDEKKFFEEFYLNEKQITEMKNNGMVIGSHSHSHKILTKLKKSQIKKELTRSTNIIKSFSKDLTFCYPYGGKKSYNNYTLHLLKTLKVKFALSVESRDIDLRDFKRNLLKLPRYDCNQFKFGKVLK